MAVLGIFLFYKLYLWPEQLAEIVAQNEANNQAFLEESDRRWADFKARIEQR